VKEINLPLASEMIRELKRENKMQKGILIVQTAVVLLLSAILVAARLEE